MIGKPAFESIFSCEKEKNPAINYKDPILQDKELINLAQKALGDKSTYGRGAADLETVRKWLHTEVPLLRWLNVSNPRELLESERREELMMALQVINNDIEPSIFFNHVKKQKEKLIVV